MRRAPEFAAAIRTGRRARRGVLVVYLHRDGGAAAPRVGLVVGKPVGGSVIRHRTSRRLRGVLATRLPRLPLGALLVVRVLAGGGELSSDQLGRDLDSALDRLTARVT